MGSAHKIAGHTVAKSKHCYVFFTFHENTHINIKIRSKIFSDLGRIMGCVNGKPVLSNEDLDFIANHTAISRDEVDRQYENFLAKHPDGKITKRDFRHMMQACFPDMDTAKLQEHIFRMYDTNCDNQIDFREFMIVLYVMSNGTPEANLKQIFRIFDINNDGTVSQKELIRLVKDLFHLFKKEDNPDKASQEALAIKAFKEMDADENGKVTQDEFVEACLNQETISKMLALKVIDVFI